MTDINDLFAQLPIGEIAKELGVSKDEASKGVALALPALVSGLHANASDPKGAASLLAALEGKDTSLVDGNISLADVDTTDGKKIVNHIFGAASPDVAAKLGGASALGSGMMKKLLPILAPIVLAFIVKQMTGSKAKSTTPSASGGIQDILGQVLGGAMSGGGSGSGGGIGDILGQVLGGAAGGGSTKASTGNAITDILGGLLGGGTR